MIADHASDAKIPLVAGALSPCAPEGDPVAQAAELL
jgi:hypothetical protein